MRVDIMSKMRGVGPFAELWDRRTVLETKDGSRYDLLSLPDLVTAKKTQRDTDWPMIRRLVEANYATTRDEPTPKRVRFWLAEARTPELLVELAGRFPEEYASMAEARRVLRAPLNIDPLDDALAEEERTERVADREYWAPLKREIEALRQSCPPL